MKQVRVLFLYAGLLFCKNQLTIDPTRVTDKKNVIHVLIIGGGAAGYAAAVHCAHAGFMTKVLAGVLPGGQLTETGIVENVPGIRKARGADIMEEQRQQVLDAGAVILQESAISVNVTQWPFEVKTDNGHVYHALTIIMATGAAPRTLGIPGEKEYWGNGVSVCAVCDARFFTGKDVVVIGGGDSAAEQALQLALYAKNVTILVRKPAMLARWSMQQKIAQTPNIKVEYQKELTSITGDDAGVTGITVYDNKHKKTEQRVIDGVFLAIGHMPRSQLVAGQVACDVASYITPVGRSQATSVPCVFVAGEVGDPDYQLWATAAGDGTKAGRDTERCLYHYGLTPQIVRAWQSG